MTDTTRDARKIGVDDFKAINPRAAASLIREGQVDERRRYTAIRTRAAASQAALADRLIADGVSTAKATATLLKDLQRREFEALSVEHQVDKLWSGSADLRATYRGQRDSFAALYQCNSRRALDAD